jgi:hypothetical protein
MSGIHVSCEPCRLAEASEVPATHRYEMALVKGASIPFCEKHLETFQRFAGVVRAIDSEPRTGP